MSYDNADQEEDPFATPPPNAPDDGNTEAQIDNPNRVASESHLRNDDSGAEGHESDLNQEDSIYPNDGENPLEAHRHASRGSQGAEEDPFAPASGGRPPPGLGGLGSSQEGSMSFARKSSSASGMRGDLRRQSSKGGTQPNLHEVMFDNKAGKKRSLASSMLSNRHRGGYTGDAGAAEKGEASEDPFANFGGGGAGNDQSQLARSGSLIGSGSQGRSQSFSNNNNQSGAFGRHASMNQAPQIISTTGATEARSISPATGISSEDRHNAENPEELFMPNMKREMFIPVRVARDKIKHVLSEMAAMKSMHLAALDTMEKQHAFLKAQLESATATYVKKLTGDYNNRVTALEAEYKRRLENLNSNAMHDVDAGVDDAKRKVAKAEEKAMQKVKDREAELEREQKMFMDKLARDNEQREQERQDIRDNEAKMEESILKVKELEMKLAKLQREKEVNAAAAGGGGGGAGGGNDGANKAKIEELEDQVAAMERQLNTADIQRKSLEQQTASAEEDAINLKLAQSRMEKLEQENAELRQKLGE